MCTGQTEIIGVLTTNVRLYYDIVKMLKAKELEFRMLNFDEAVPLDIGVVLTSVDELDIIDYEPKIAVEDVEMGIRQAILALCGLNGDETVVVGVDPGPKPGIALICDDRIIETQSTHSPEDASNRIIKILEDYAFKRSILKMGHGAPEYRDRMLAILSNYFSHVEIIDEFRTSSKSHSRHEDAAVAIARHCRKKK